LKLRPGPSILLNNKSNNAELWLSIHYWAYDRPTPDTGSTTRATSALIHVRGVRAPGYGGRKFGHKSTTSTVKFHFGQ